MVFGGLGVLIRSALEREFETPELWREFGEPWW